MERKKKLHVRVPRPDRVRTTRGTSYGWLDARLLHEGWLAALGPEAFAVYAFLCLVADRQGVSFYRRGRIGALVGLDDLSLSRALGRLEELDLVAYEPFRPGAPDGFRQVLALPRSGPRSPFGGLLDELSARFQAPGCGR